MHNPDSVGSGYYVTTYFWTCFAVSDGKNSPCVMQVTIKENSVEFAPYGATSDADSAFYVVSAITNNGTFSTKKYSSTQRYSPSFQNKIVGYKMSGNVMIQTSISNSAVPFTVYYAPDKSTQLLMDVIDVLTQMNTQQIVDSHEILMQLIDIFDECDTIEEQLSEVCDLLEDNTESLDALGFRMEQIISQMKEVQNKQIEQIGWLKKIWESIQEFFEPKEEEKDTTDKFEEENKEQSDKLNNLNEQNKTDKVEVDNASGSVDGYIDGNAISNYGELLKIFTNNEYILRCILVVLAIGLVSYVLFGKKR